LTRREQKENNGSMSAALQPSVSSAAGLDAAADQATAACGGDAREAVKALIVANDFLEVQLEELRSKVSAGYARGRLPSARDRKE
jgi:hypothetical protein